MKLTSFLVVILFIVVATTVLNVFERDYAEGYANFNSLEGCDGPSGCPRLPVVVGCGQDTTVKPKNNTQDCPSPSIKGADLPGGFDIVDALPKGKCGGCGAGYKCGWNNSVSGDCRYKYAPEDSKTKNRVYKYPHYYGYGTGSGFHYGEPYYTRTVNY